MDPLSHAVTGAALAQSAARRKEVVAATVVGVLAGMFPDVDIFIRSETDPLLNIEYHRQFTHALIMVPVFALLLSGALHLFVRRWLSFGRSYLFSFLALLHHGILDAMTSYGTHLFWPFTDRRESWSIVAVVDPLYTLPILLLVIVGLLRRSPVPARIALLFAAAFLSLGALQTHRAKLAGYELAASRGHEPVRLEAKPTVFNNILFRLIYETDDRFYVDAVRVNWWGNTMVYEGASTDRLSVEEARQGIPEDSPQYTDIQRFAFFSDDYLYLPSGLNGTIGDLRYALLPDSLEPLWVIELNPERPEGHVDYRVARDFGETELERFRRMLLGDRNLDQNTE
ncbi:MAG: metal-dependent hydrolase [Opitutales bacterium]|nr:metal-dependent hydrolase [Opitutales bacterium]